MADIQVQKHGRTFEFPEGTDADVQERRIRAWMEKNAPGELGGGESGAATSRGSIETNVAAPGIHTDIFDRIAEGAKDLFKITPEAKQELERRRARAGSFMQGVTPFAEEGAAKIRALLRGSNYDEELAAERKMLHDYEQANPGSDMARKLWGGLTGAALTALPIGKAVSAAGSALPAAAAWVGRHPWLATTAMGAGTGAIQGFGAGEGGFGPRMENAGENALIGAALAPAARLGTEGVRWGWDKLYGPNALAAYLRGRIPSEMGDELAGTPGVTKLPTGRVDPNAPDFGRNVERVMNRELQRQRRLSTSPMVADLMPGTTEAVLQKPGDETTDLAKQLAKRQYDFNLAKTNDTLADATSQRGRVSDWFDYLFGQDKFKADEKQLVDQLQQTGRQAFQQAYGQMVNSPSLERALGNPYVQQAWDKAAKLAEADGRRIGVPIRGGNGAVGQYDVQFLHDLKTTMDDMLRGDTKEYADKFLNPRTGKLNKEGYRLNSAVRSLNNEIKALSPEYKAATERYASDAEILGALRRGHEDFFGTPEKGGMGIPEIRKFFNDPNIRDEVKDAMRIGAARAARSKLMEGEGKAYTHNWADFINKPQFADRLKFISQPHLWDTAYNALRAEAKNYAQVAKATGNSRTAARLQMNEELSNAMPGLANTAATAALTPRTAAARAIGNVLTYGSRSRMGTDNANKMAQLLAAKTPVEHRAATKTIRDLLDRAQSSDRFFDTMSNFLPYASVYGFPGHE